MNELSFGQRMSLHDFADNEKVNQLCNTDTCIATLEELLMKEKKLHFIFRTGYIKQYHLKGHCFPLKNSFRETHKTALTGIEFLYLIDGETIHCMLRIRYTVNIERKEYMVKRALESLTNDYGWLSS